MRHGGMNACAPPIFGHGKLFLNTASGGWKLFAMQVGGHGDVTNTAVDWKCDKGVPARSSPLLVGDLIFLVSDAGVASVVEAKTGKPVRQRRLSGEFSTSPLYADGRVFLSNQEGRPSCFRPIATSSCWRRTSSTMARWLRPAVYDKAIYLRTKTHLYRLQEIARLIGEFRSVLGRHGMRPTAGRGRGVSSTLYTKA